jgi:predicted RND superfamily exporter protein
MQKRLVLLVLFGFVGLNFFLFAQDNKKKVEFESFKKKRIAFISKKMDLTDNETRVFWPVCNELQEKKFAIHRQIRKLTHDFNRAEEEGKTHSEEEYMELINTVTNAKVQEAKLEKEYIAKFTEIISARKIYLYQEAERQFAREMLEERRK